MSEIKGEEIERGNEKREREREEQERDLKCEKNHTNECLQLACAERTKHVWIMFMGPHGVPDSSLSHRLLRTLKPLGKRVFKTASVVSTQNYIYVYI